MTAAQYVFVGLLLAIIVALTLVTSILVFHINERTFDMEKIMKRILKENDDHE